MENIISKKVGRKPAVISWPMGQFTIKEVQASSGKSNGCVRIKVSKALESGILKSNGKRSGSKGKSAMLYSLVANPTNETLDATQA